MRHTCLTREPGRPLAAAVLAVLLGACGAGTAGSSGSGSLRGRTFISESVTHEGQPRPDRSVYLEFHDDGRLSASAGCNTVSGEPDLRGGRLRLPEQAMTLMACPGDEDADGLISGLLDSEPAYTLDGGRLTLSSEKTTVVLRDREVADPDRPLSGTTWQLDGYHEGSDDEDIAWSARGATVRFDAGRVTVRVDGCNESSGRAEIRERTITFPDSFVTTKESCSERQLETATHLMSVLKGTVTYEVEAGQLRIDRPDGPGLTFRSAG